MSLPISPAGRPTSAWFEFNLRQVALVAFACVAVFGLPWLFPPTALVADSGIGFSNRIAILGLLGSVFLAFLFALRDRSSSAALELFETEPVLFPPFEEAKYEYSVLVLGSLFAGLSLTLLYVLLVSPYWGDADYYLSRIDLVALGFAPYRDFQFSYGPLFLYIPTYLSRATFGWISLEQGYVTTLIGLHVVGFFQFFLVVRSLRLTERQRVVLLALVTLGWMTFTFGLNATPARFAVIPSALVLLSDATRRNRLWFAAGIAASAVLLSSGFSPDMGIASVVSLIVYGASCILGGRRAAGVFVFSGVTLAALALLRLDASYLRSIAGFGQGAYSWPVVPNPINVAFVAAAIAVVAPLAAATLQKRSAAQAPLASALVVVFFAMAAPALTRADPGHVYWNGFIPFLLLPVAFAAKRRFRRGVAAYVGLALLPYQISFWSHYSFLGNFERILSDSKALSAVPDGEALREEAWSAYRKAQGSSDALVWSKPVQLPLHLDTYVKRGRVCAAIRTRVEIDRFLKAQPHYRPLYYPPPASGMFSPEDARRAISETASCDFVVVPFLGPLEALSGPHAQKSRLNLSFLHALLLLPLNITMSRTPYVPEKEVYLALLEQRVIEETWGKFVVLGALKPDAREH